jgi:hypothetical protein
MTDPPSLQTRVGGSSLSFFNMTDPPSLQTRVGGSSLSFSHTTDPPSLQTRVGGSSFFFQHDGPTLAANTSQWAVFDTTDPPSLQTRVGGSSLSFLNTTDPRRTRTQMSPNNATRVRWFLFLFIRLLYTNFQVSFIYYNGSDTGEDLPVDEPCTSSRVDYLFV